MAKKCFNINATLTDNFRVMCTVRDFSYYLNMPAMGREVDSGVSPLEALLAAMGACQCIVTKFFAPQQGINLKEIKIDMSGEFDSDRFLGINEKGEIGFTKITSKFYIKADNSETEIRNFINFVVKNSPVNGSIKSSLDIITEVYSL